MLAAADAAIDPQHVVITEPVRGSDIPVHLMYVEMIDGVYAPIGLRTPPGAGAVPAGAVRVRQWRARHGDGARPTANAGCGSASRA